ncbi:MAG: DUF6998 domain-containing protein [Thermoleophilia bacterium]
MALSDDDLRELFARFNDFELLGLWARLMAELNGRGVIRSDNNPMGDYCEFLVAAHYGVKPEGNSNAGYDVTTPDGIKIQVKGRRVRADGGTPAYFSGVRNLSDEPPPFDFLVGLILNRDFSVREAWQLPVERVRHYATYRKHTNSWSLPTIRGAMLEDPEVKRLELRLAPTGVAIPQKSPPAAASALRAPCACGCGSYPKGKNSRFLPGHDAKLRSEQLRQWMQGHLSVAVRGVDSGEHFAELEKHVVEVLLPALSVEHTPPSQLRGQLLDLHAIVVHGIDDLWVAPDPSLSDWRKILIEYGLAFDGYRYAKLVRRRKCVELADEVWQRFEAEQRFTSSFADLRCALFWMQRWVRNAEQSPGWKPSPELEDRVHRLYAAIQEAWRRERLSQP